MKNQKRIDELKERLKGLQYAFETDKSISVNYYSTMYNQTYQTLKKLL